MRLLRPALALLISASCLPLEAARAVAAVVSVPEAIATPTAPLAVAGAVANAAPILAPAAIGLTAAPTLSLAPAPSLIIVAQPSLSRVRERVGASGEGRTAAATALAQTRAIANTPDAGAVVFDGARKQAAVAKTPVPSARFYSAAPLALLAAPASPWLAGAAAPAAHIAASYVRERKEAAKEAPKADWREAAEPLAAWLGISLFSFMAAGLLSGSLALAPVLGLLWAFGGIGMRQLLEEGRSRVIGGWQASHDQRYRVGSDGRLRDVRGHKYGEDRYDRRAPGPIRPWENLALRILSAGTGLAFAAAAGPLAAAAYGITWTLANAAYDAFRRRSAPPPALDAEERAFVSRFNR